MVAVFFIQHGNQDDLYLGRDIFIRLPPEESVGRGWLRCISATCATVRPRNKSAFAEFGNAAIFGKWHWNDVRARPDLFAILSWLLTLIQPARILLWVERRRMLT